MKKIACCIFSYEITKGMKSFGPMALLKSSSKNEELIIQQINHINKLFHSVDFFVIVGFGSDKIQKKLPKNVKSILNTEYENKNHGYAFKLILSQYTNISQYDGLLILNNNILIKNNKNITDLPTNSSWVLSKRKNKRETNDKNLGCIINTNEQLDYIFYGIGEYEWYEMLYLCNNDAHKIGSSLDSFYDNMFLFEVINKSITLNNIQYNQILVPHNTIIQITGMKDKQKLNKIL